MHDAATTTADATPAPKTASSFFKFDRWDAGLAIGFLLALAIGSIELKTLTGLPAHPLLLHMPVIFVPLLAIAAIAFAFKPAWRKRYGLAYGIGAIVTMAGTGIAAGAGEALKASRDRIGEGVGAAAAAVAGGPDGAESRALEHHAQLGSATRVVVFAFVVVILGQVAIDRGVAPAIVRWFSGARAPLAIALSVLTLGLAAASGALVVATGHAGAKVTFGHDAAAADGAPPWADRGSAPGFVPGSAPGSAPGAAPGAGVGR